METLKETLQAQQAEAVKKLDQLHDERISTLKVYEKAKHDHEAQRLIVEQNARALKAFEPRKPRAKKTGGPRQEVR
jgi:hypothetical protein